MIEQLFGSQNIEKVLFFLLMNDKCYATQLQRHFKKALTPIQQALLHLEKKGVLASYQEGKTRFFHFNSTYPCLYELEALLKKAFSLLPVHRQKEYYHLALKQDRCKQGHFSPGLNTVHTIWKRLSNVQTLSFSAKSKAGGQSGWNGVGKGEVEVKLLHPHVILFQERGTWISENEQQFDFSNIFRWTLDLKANAITLEHLRFGIHNPVFLFQLAPVDQHTLESVTAHICQEDTYCGQVRCDKHFVQLHWRILGPKKNEEIDYLYT